MCEFGDSHPTTSIVVPVLQLIGKPSQPVIVLVEGGRTVCESRANTTATNAAECVALTSNDHHMLFRVSLTPNDHNVVL